MFRNTFEVIEPILNDCNAPAQLRAEAMETIWEAGVSSAAPTLRKYLVDGDPAIRGAAAKALGQLKDKIAVSQLISLVSDIDQQVRVRSIKALGRTRAWAAGAQLQAILANPDEVAEVRSAAAFSIGMMDYWEATSTLIEAVKNSVSEIRRTAITALRRIRSEDATPALVAALTDENDSVRITVANVLREIRDARSVIPLVRAVTDSNFFVCGAAVTALGHIGVSASFAGPALAELVNCKANRWPPGADNDKMHPSDEVIKNRAAAVTALGRIGDGRFLDPLMSALKDDDSGVRGSAATALGRVADKRGIDALILALSDPAPDVCGSAAAALGMLRANKAFHSLTTKLQSSAENVRVSASEALAKIRNRDAIPYLSAALDREAVAKVRGAICTALGNLGGREASGILVARMQNDTAHDVKGSAASALGRIGDKQAVGALIDALESEHSDVRSSAAGALGRIGDNRACNALIELLAKDPDEWTKVTAIGSLARIGDRKTASRLIDVLNNPSFTIRVRAKAAVALGYLGDNLATPALLAATNGPRQLSRSSLIALGMLRDENSLGILRRIAAAETEHPAKRTQALTSLGKIISFGDVDDFIYVLAGVPMKFKELSERQGDFLATQAIRTVALKGDGGRAVALLKEVSRSDPVSENRLEAIGGLGRLGALDSELVEFLINPETTGPRGSATVDPDEDVRGRVCNLLLREFAQGEKPTPEKIVSLARQFLIRMRRKGRSKSPYLLLDICRGQTRIAQS